MEYIDKFNESLMQTYNRFPLVIKYGNGDKCISEDSKEYIDFGSGIAVNSIGFSDKGWADAVCKQVQSLAHTSNLYYTKVQGDYAEKLVKTTGYDKVFFSNSGAEANECAIKLARKYSFDKYGKNRHNIITLKNSFHGRTMATISATGQDSFHDYFFPFIEGFIYTEPNDFDDIACKIDGSVCGVMLEFVQGEGGVNVLEKEYIRNLKTLCEEKDILFIADEVQTGIGRTGTFLASEQYGVLPDITTLAKGIAGGLPMGACLANPKTSGVLTAGTHGSTFGGNPVCCAGASFVIDKIMSDGFLKNVTEKGDWLKKEIQKLEEVESVSGIGLMLGIKLKTKNAAEIARKCLEKGLLVLTAKTKIRLVPPLTISQEDLEIGVKIFSEVIGTE